MRIAQVSTVATPVRPSGAGSVESIVHSLTAELTRHGHQVTIFAAAGSDAPCEVVETLAGPYAQNGAPGDWHVCEWINLCAAVERSRDFDVVHSHAYLWGLPLEPVARCPMVHTLHVAPYADDAALWQANRDACVTSISEFQWASFPSLRPAAVIPHGVDPARHTFQPEAGDYACFLGRFIPDKGPVEAVKAARALDLRVVLAGPRNDFYDHHVAPLVDGRNIEYAGPVGESDRDALLGGACVLLYPVQGPEPFGLVLIEAMMSGTPVAAFSIGAVPEIVDDGVTGACVPAGGHLTDAIRAALSLDRSAVRTRALERFTAERMAWRYTEVYERVVERAWAL